MIEGLVSIIMPSYNAARFIGESINSVLLQTYSNWELLIVDDCSKDNSVEVVRKFANIDKRVVLFSLEKNVGAAAARNVAIEHAQGQYIAFLDSDDVWDEYKLEKQLAFMKHSPIKIGRSTISSRFSAVSATPCSTAPSLRPTQTKTYSTQKPTMYSISPTTLRRCKSFM